MSYRRHRKTILSAAVIALSCTAMTAHAQDTDTDESEAVGQNDLLNATLWMSNSGRAAPDEDRRAGKLGTGRIIAVRLS